MKQIDLSSLTRFTDGTYKGKIDWKSNIGSNIPFTYDNVHGKLKIIDYIPDKPVASIVISYNDNIKQLTITNLKKCNIGNITGIYNYNYLYDIDDIIYTTDRNLMVKIKEQIKLWHTRSYERGYVVKCLSCGHEYKVRELHISSCHHCSDRVSYGEKFVICILNQLKVNFETQKIFEWSDLKRYDLYIPDKNIIIEVNGLEHYSPVSFDPNMSKEEYYSFVVTNDNIKHSIANQNSINEYIIIDTRESNVDYIKRSILKSDLNIIYDLSCIEWNLCDEFATSSIAKIASELWNKSVSIDEIANALRLSPASITNYLRKGNEFGYCIYDKHINMSNSRKLNKHKTQKPVICITTGEIFSSQSEATLHYNLYKTGVNDCCKKRIPSAGKHPTTKEPLVWEYYIK